MDTQDFRTLQLLEEIDQSGAPSQRDLAKKLNISLGLVNSFIKRLAQKGYFKITTIPKNRVKYILTPKGAAEKTQLTYEYIQFSYRYFKEARRKLKKLFTALDESGVRRMAFYGVGDFAEIAFLSLQDTALELKAVVDERKSGEKFFGMKILTLDELGIIAFDKLLITAVDYHEPIYERLVAHGIAKRDIVIMQ